MRKVHHRSECKERTARFTVSLASAYRSLRQRFTMHSLLQLASTSSGAKSIKRNATGLGVTISYYCVFIAALLPYLFGAYSKMTPRYFSGGNRAPREYAQELEGAKKRAFWAHQNGFEAFPTFAAVVIIATLVDRAGPTTDRLAMAFIMFRVVYGVFYVLDLATLRSIAWMGGAGCVVAMIGVIVS